MIMENENLSVAAFERKVNVGRNSISSAIRKESVIGHKVLHRISKAFPQYSIDWIVSGKDSPHADALNLAMKIKKLTANYEELKKN